MEEEKQRCAEAMDQLKEEILSVYPEAADWFWELWKKLQMQIKGVTG